MASAINPQYESWLTIDQLLLNWLYNSMTPEIAIQVMGHENAKDLWATIQELFEVQFARYFSRPVRVLLKWLAIFIL